MDDKTLLALRTDRVVDITTLGRKSGEPRRIEIVLIALSNGGFALSSSPGRQRGWVANVKDHPEFTVHIKRSLQADLPAKATVVTDPAERRFLMQLMHDSDAERAKMMTNMEEWVAKSPMVKVEFL